MPQDRGPSRRLRARASLIVPLAAVVVLAAAVVVAVTLHDDQPVPGTLAAAADLSGQTYTVGGKNNFDEQPVLCAITVAALRAVAATVVDRCEIGGTAETRQALRTGEIDLYWEYTGTAWATFLGGTGPPPEPGTLFDLVRSRDEPNGVVWLAPSAFDDSYAFAMNADRARELGITSLSGMAAYLRAGRPGTICVEPEYAARTDGFGPLQRAYGFGPAPGAVRLLDTPSIYQDTAGGRCLFGEVFTTDGRIPYFGLRVLDDDRRFHPDYRAAPTIRRDAFDRDPDIARVLAPVAAALDQPTMTMLNGEVSVVGRAPEDVAEGWLASRGFVSSR